MAAGSPEQLTALAALPGQRTGPAPPAGADPGQELLSVLELRGWALLEQHQALGSAHGWVHSAMGREWGRLEQGQTPGWPQIWIDP